MARALFLQELCLFVRLPFSSRLLLLLTQQKGIKKQRSKALHTMPLPPSVLISLGSSRQTPSRSWNSLLQIVTFDGIATPRAPEGTLPWVTGRNHSYQITPVSTWWKILSVAVGHRGSSRSIILSTWVLKVSTANALLLYLVFGSRFSLSYC